MRWIPWARSRHHRTDCLRHRTSVAVRNLMKRHRSGGRMGLEINPSRPRNGRVPQRFQTRSSCAHQETGVVCDCGHCVCAGHRPVDNALATHANPIGALVGNSSLGSGPLGAVRRDRVDSMGPAQDASGTGSGRTTFSSIHLASVVVVGNIRSKLYGLGPATRAFLLFLSAEHGRKLWFDNLSRCRQLLRIFCHYELCILRLGGSQR